MYHVSAQGIDEPMINVHYYYYYYYYIACMLLSLTFSQVPWWSHLMNIPEELSVFSVKKENRKWRVMFYLHSLDVVPRSKWYRSLQPTSQSRQLSCPQDWPIWVIWVLWLTVLAVELSLKPSNTLPLRFWQHRVSFDSTELSVDDREKPARSLVVLCLTLSPSLPCWHNELVSCHGHCFPSGLPC